VPNISRRDIMLLTGMGMLAAATSMPEGRTAPPRQGRPGDPAPPGVRLRGSNIVCTGYPLGKFWKTYGTTVWAAMWTVWDWNNWIKPQIDDAAALGNTVRLWGSTQTFLAGNITEEKYFAQWRQLLDYCAAKGLYMMPTGSDLQTGFAESITSSAAATHYTTWADMLAQYPGVIGVDLMNEAWGVHDSYDWILPVLRGCADAMHSKGLPVTVSFAITDPTMWVWDPNDPGPAGPGYTKYPVAPFFELTDYLDFHIYATSTPAQVASTYANPWAAGKAMVFGEFGMGTDQPPAARTAFYEMVRDLVIARTDNSGAVAWSCYDVNNTNNQYGLYSAPGVLRTDIATPFATFPTDRID
jgi:hypothetical protein